MGKLKSELTWSYSRDQIFKECRRAYFYHYYASWEGWEADADEFKRKAYILKNVRNIDAWIGDIVHRTIKWILESKITHLPATLFDTPKRNAEAGEKDSFPADKTISYEEAASFAKGLLLKTWEQSRSKMWTKSVKYNLNLFEHYYHREPTRQELAQKLQKVTKSIRNIYRCGLLEYFLSLSKENILCIEELDNFDFEGVKVFALPDFAVDDNGYKLYDWKTGKRNERDILQLSCYVLYAMNKWKAQAEKVRVVPVYLSEDEISIDPVECVNPEEVKTYIRASISEMKSLLSSVSENKAEIKNYPKTDSPRQCQTCKFQEICK